MNNKKKLMIMIILGILIIAFVGISYAWLSVNILGEKTTVIKVGSLDLVLDESLSNGITMDNAVAITDEEGLSQEGSNFSLINNGNADICYEIYLDDMDLNEGDIRIDDKYIKYSLDKNTSKGSAKVLTSGGANPNRIINKGTIDSKETINFKLRLWLNSEENGNYSGQVFKGKIRVEGTQCSVPIMKAYTSDFTVDYHAEEYRAKVTSIETKNNTMVPEDAIESWDVSATGDNSVIAYAEDDGVGGYKITIGGGNGGIRANTNSSSLFYNFTSLTKIDLSYLDTSNVTNMSYMFQNCMNLVTLNLSGFDTSKVVDMSAMFLKCESLTELDIGNFDTSNVKNMHQMFQACSSLTSLDLSVFDTSKVTDMALMFHGCYKLEYINISSFDTSNVTTMERLFSDCFKLKFLDLRNFDTSNVINMSLMFHYCLDLEQVDLNHFDTEKVTNMSGMFLNCSALTKLDLRTFNTVNVINMSKMFYGTSNITQILVTDIWTTNIADTTDMFTASRINDVTYD